MKKVSVLMCTYKESKDFVKESIDSILCQTYEDFEFVIVHDCPENDELFQFLKSYQERDRRIVLFRNETNLGLTKSLNVGLGLCGGEYIVRIDADDIALPERISKQVSFMDANPNVVASGSNAYTIDTSGKILSTLRRSSDPNVLKSSLIFQSPIYHPAAIFRRIINGFSVRYNEERKYSQDYALWIQLSRYGDLSNIPECLIKYRISEEQISTKNHFAQQECAKQNQLEAIETLGLIISGREIELLASFSRNPNTDFDRATIEDFIVRFLAINKSNSNICYNVLRNKMLLMYYNYVARNYNIIHSLISFFRTSRKVSYYSIYGFLAIVNKYRLKYATNRTK